MESTAAQRTSPRIPRSKPGASNLKSSVISNLKMIEMIILGGKTTIIRNNICAHCLHQVCVVAHARRSRNTQSQYLFKNSFDPKTAHFALFARFSTMKHLAVSIYSSILIMLLLEISGEHV